MGRGNWFPGNSLEDCEVVYVELPVSEDDEDMYSFYWQEFRGYLLQLLPSSWDAYSTWGEVYSRFDGVGRDDIPLAYNGLFGLFIDGQAEGYHVGIGMVCRSDAPAFAKSRLRETAQRLFDRLQTEYELSVRTSAWTSAKRVVGGWKR